MESTIERTSILLSSNPASRQAASAIYFTNGNFRIEWFSNIHSALENLISLAGFHPNERPTLVQLPSAQV